MEFEGKVAVVTGGGSGIGRSVALALAKLGADVVIADREEQRLEEVSADLAVFGHRILPVLCDVGSDADVEDLAARTISTFGKVDVLMNNAGIFFAKPPDEMSMADWESMLNVNLFGVIRGVTAFLPHMIKRRSGHIVNTASLAGLRAPSPEQIAYSTSKFGIVGLSENLALYACPKGVGVSVLCPGIVRTRMFQVNTNHPGARLPSSTISEPDDVAQLVVQAIREKRFLILISAEAESIVRQKGADIEAFVQGRIEERRGQETAS